MKLWCAILPLAMLLMGCGPSPGEVIGVYRLSIDGQPQGSLELKSDATYVQTIKLPEQPEQIRTGRWRLGEFREAGKSPGYFAANPDTQGHFVYLENAMAIQECPRCRAIPFEVVPLSHSSGMMNVALSQDPKGNVAYLQ